MGGIEGVKEGLHAVRAREDNPVVAMDAGDRFDQGHLLLRGFDPDCRQLESISPEHPKRTEECAGLLSCGAGDGDPLSEEGLILEPRKSVTEMNHVTKDRDSGGLEFEFRCKRGNG